jgi:hypothetical protein
MNVYQEYTFFYAQPAGFVPDFDENHRMQSCNPPPVSFSVTIA